MFTFLFTYIHCTLLCSDEVGYDNTRSFRFFVVDETSVSFKSILQKLFRILGRYYEHQRTDRDAFVDINERNIKRGKNCQINACTRFLLVCMLRDLVLLVLHLKRAVVPYLSITSGPRFSSRYYLSRLLFLRSSYIISRSSLFCQSSLVILRCLLWPVPLYLCAS